MSPSQSSSLDQWLQYIEAIHPVEIELGLERLQQVADRLILSKKKPYVFTVAGTNGKGTTTAAIAALARESGQTVGWYTSPHLFKFNERVRVNGNDISDEKLAEAFHAVNVARKDITLSYFEFTTLAAFWVFAQLNLDVWVLEVGLGGRLDAVNIIDPDIAVITNVGLDHQGFLGDTLEEIGLEKSGICRKNKALVLGSDSFPPRVREFQLATGAHVYDFNTIHGVTQDSVYWQDGSISVEFIGIPYPNAAAALQAFELSPFDITHQQIQQAFADIKMAGRMQLFVRNGRKITVDVGHNPHAANYISSQLSREKHHLVLGMLGDKDPKAFLKELESNVLSVNTISLDVPRGLSASELAERLDTSGVRAFTSLAQCFNHLDQHYPGEPLFIGGSFYTVCEALTFLEN